jgi:hypothetical protein
MRLHSFLYSCLSAQISRATGRALPISNMFGGCSCAKLDKFPAKYSICTHHLEMFRTRWLPWTARRRAATATAPTRGASVIGDAKSPAERNRGWRASIRFCQGRAHRGRFINASRGRLGTHRPYFEGLRLRGCSIALGGRSTRQQLHAACARTQSNDDFQDEEWPNTINTGEGTPTGWSPS